MEVSCVPSRNFLYMRGNIVLKLVFALQTQQKYVSNNDIINFFPITKHKGVSYCMGVRIGLIGAINGI
jgi:hypothetical protein